MWNGIGWYGFIGVITTSTTDISLGPNKRIFFLELVQQIINTLCLCLVRLSKSVISLNFILLQILGCFQNSTVITFWNTVSFILIFLISCFLKNNPVFHFPPLK